jgi:rhodanese-related sulfurtransferase
LIALRRSIQDSGPNAFVIFDVRIPAVAERLHEKRAEHQERSEIEALDQNHYVLLIVGSRETQEPAK